LGARADRTLVVSQRDREAIGDTPGLCIVPNAVDLEAFPFAGPGREPATLVFTGNMGYFPNVNAVLWFARQVLPRVRQARPDVRLLIVGARPARSVRALAGDGAVTVTGRVEDIGPYLRRAAVAVVPMRSGSGQQFKILEAMASGAPIVATAAEAEQVGARHERELLVADEASAFAEAVLALLRDPARAADLAQSARRLVEAHFTWRHSVEALEAVYESALRERSGRAMARPS
jgi:glycosyltransferase involved in cell wall biosynthesis